MAAAALSSPLDYSLRCGQLPDRELFIECRRASGMLGTQRDDSPSLGFSYARTPGELTSAGDDLGPRLLRVSRCASGSSNENG